MRMVSFQQRLFAHAMILGTHGGAQFSFTSILRATRIVAAKRRCQHAGNVTASAAALLSQQLLLHNRRQRFCSILSSAVGPTIHQEDDPSNNEQTWLVVGDGDLSYSASIASSLHESRIALFASVLEDQETHEQIYRNSKKHSDTILRYYPRHQVIYGVDATALEGHGFCFSPKSTTTSSNTTQTSLLLFDRVIFNFPHWKGKSNHRYNRQLLNDFFKSVVNVIHPETGQVHVALVTGQGGMEIEEERNKSSSSSSRILEWKQSWKIAMHANNHGLLLRQVQPFRVDYDLSSHRGVDRAFSPGDEPVQYIFGPVKRNSEAVQERFQIACRHELRIRLSADGTTASGAVNGNNNDTRTTIFSLDELQNGISTLAKRIAPIGIRVEMPLNEIVQSPSQQPPSLSLLVFLIVYAGEAMPLSRATANEIRSRLEMAVEQELGLEIAKPGRMVSKPFPYALLDALLKENIDMEQKN